MGPWALLSDTGEAGGIVVVIILAIVFALILAVLKGSDQKRILRAVANRLGGNVVSGYWGGDRVECRIDGAPAQLSHFAGSRGTAPFTRLRWDRAPTGSLRVFREGFFASIRKAFGAQDIAVGDQRFDDEFVIQGSPEPWVRQTLDPEARRRILALNSLGQMIFGGNAFTLDAGPAGVTITCGRDLMDDEVGIQSFLDHALALLSRIGVVPSEGIQILSATSTASRGECPVCANPLGIDARRCPACATPHHSDCWDYFGGCAIYGCRFRGGRGG
jgi:hypothetical protein